jgi:hypothetical protein
MPAALPLKRKIHSVHGIATAANSRRSQRGASADSLSGSFSHQHKLIQTDDYLCDMGLGEIYSECVDGSLFTRVVWQHCLVWDRAEESREAKCVAFPLKNACGDVEMPHSEHPTT